MDGRMDPKHDFTHELHQRGKQDIASILLLGGAGKEGIQAFGRSLTKGAKIVSNNMGVTSKRDARALSSEMTM
jgi:hypothetical protein